MKYLLVFTTFSNLKEARKLASILLKEKAAACVQISSPIESHYRWQGKLEKSKEVQVTLKTSSALYPKVEKIIRAHHSYSIPELIAVPIVKGSRGYLAWLDREIKK